MSGELVAGGVTFARGGMMVKQTRQTVAVKVRDYLKDCHPGGITLDLIESGVRKEEYWWYVPIRPSAWPEKMFEFYEALAEIEEQLEEREHMKVLLVSREPEAATVV
jgi:hypothetical protein